MTVIDTKNKGKPLDITQETITKDLKTNYRFVEAQIKKARADVRKNGIKITSPANGIVRNPAITVYDTLMKQQLAINKQLMEIEDKKPQDDDNDDLGKLARR